jgi:tetratricopeptide (TPR) repeat protein
MITLRVFDSAAEAAIAKSVLDDRGISCSLADEASHLYGGAPGAIPVRLLVREDQAEEALRILDAPAAVLPENFDVMTGGEETEDQPSLDVAVELRTLKRTVRRLAIVSTVLFFLLWCFVAYLLTERPTYVDRLWRNISLATRQSDLERARRIAQVAVKQYPRDYWSHEWLAMVDSQLKDFAGAETEYQRAYDLLPSERIKKHLQEVRIKKESQATTSASPSPRPQWSASPGTN